MLFISAVASSGAFAQQGARANDHRCHDPCRATARASGGRGSSVNVGQKMKRLVAILSSCFVLVACSKWSVDTEWKSGAFRLIAIDAKSQMSLVHEDSPISLVGPTIFAVGADDRHVVLKQHPATDEAATSFDRSITNFFVVGRDKQVRGPLKKEEFEALSASLSLPPFTKVFEALR
jgi:hypothetical protein